MILLIFYIISGEFFIDINLPVTLKYESSLDCSSLAINTDELQEKLKTAVNTIPECRGKCVISSLDTQCKNNGIKITIIITFNVIIYNPHPNEVPLNCNTTCKRDSMINMLRTAFNVSEGIKKIVNNNKQMLELSKADSPSLDVNGTLNHPEFVGRPQMLCDNGHVLTRTRLCGKHSLCNIPDFIHRTRN